MQPRTCGICGREFVPRESAIKTCSRSCGGVMANGNRKKIPPHIESISEILTPTIEVDRSVLESIYPPPPPFPEAERGDFIRRPHPDPWPDHHSTTKIGKRIIVIPDTQVKPGYDQTHLKHVGMYIADKRPDIVVHIGDHWDMESLSSYDKGKASFEGRRYINDVNAGNEAMDLLTSQYRGLYKPEEHFFIGNHEERIARTQDVSPELGGAIGYHHLNLNGWIVHDFLEVAEIEGIKFAHYFTSGLYGRPVSSAAAMLKEAQGSAVQGHAQKVDMAVHPKSGTIAMMVGVCYMHDEGYLGPQGNNCRRQIVVLNEVKDGLFDPLFCSLAYLERRYGGK